MAKKKEPARIWFFCPTCGCLDIECTAWVNMNTEEMRGSCNEGPSDDVWCPVCETHDGAYDEGSEKDAWTIRRIFSKTEEGKNQLIQYYGEKMGLTSTLKNRKCEVY